jgi:hypothetical protein
MLMVSDKNYTGSEAGGSKGKYSVRMIGRIHNKDMQGKHLIITKPGQVFGSTGKIL